jgi:pimeloyl-ACP methyl ester carboxylesterase
VRAAARLARAALVVLAGALLLEFAGGAASARARTAGTGWDSCTSRPGDVRFRAADGTRLVGHRFGDGRTAVVLSHQVDGNLCQWLAFGRRLAGIGYSALAFDFRSYGQSQYIGSRRANRIAGDVAAAARYMRKHGARKVFLVGASMGGTATLAAGANVKPPVAGVVSVSGPATFGGADAAAAVPRLKVPVLYLAAADDSGFVDDARALYKTTSSSDKSIAILPGSDHGVALVASSARARKLVEAFLKSH